VADKIWGAAKLAWVVVGKEHLRELGMEGVSLDFRAPNRLYFAQWHQAKRSRAHGRPVASVNMEGV
jgi:hypothetical protein